MGTFLKLPAVWEGQRCSRYSSQARQARSPIAAIDRLHGLHLGGMSQRTHDGYPRAVRQLADYCRTAPDKIREAQLRRYSLFLKNEKKFTYGRGRGCRYGRPLPRPWP